MPSVSEVRSKLPNFSNIETKLVDRQDIDDLINGIITKFYKHQSDYDKICDLFVRKSAYATGNCIWRFLKYNYTYEGEPRSSQTVRSPSQIVSGNFPIDCKHYSLFAGGLLDAIQRNYAVNWDWEFRFAGYDDDTVVRHVFVVITKVKDSKDGELWLDPVLNSFDNRYQYSIFKNIKPMALYELNGIADTSTNPLTIDVDMFQSYNDFVLLVRYNVFGLRELINSRRDIVMNEIKMYCEENNFNFDLLIDALL